MKCDVCKKTELIENGVTWIPVCINGTKICDFCVKMVMTFITGDSQKFYANKKKHRKKSIEGLTKSVGSNIADIPENFMGNI